MPHYYSHSQKAKEADKTVGMSNKIRSSMPGTGTICKGNGVVGRNQVAAGGGGTGFEEGETPRWTSFMRCSN